MKFSEDPEKVMEEVGKELLSLPEEEGQLMDLLERAESFLSKVEQSPQQSMLKALDPVMKGLVSDDLLRHHNADVKVAVASCISEITRITAPDAPYDDDLMKVIFELIVETFAGLNDSGQLGQLSYRRRLSILETVAKVRSCVVMLDLECDALILEMFRHFFRARRAAHADTAYSLMETIMTVVLEESEEFSSELIRCLLDSVKDGQDASRELGESVIMKCGAKLKPYLLKEVQSSGIRLSEYSNVVASVCQISNLPDNNELNAVSQVNDMKLSGKTVSGELQPVFESTEVQGTALKDAEAPGDKSSEPIISNGIASIAEGPSTVPAPNVRSKQARLGDPKGSNASITGSSDKLESKIDKARRQSAKKSKGRKDKSTIQLAEISDRSPMDVDKGEEPSNSKDVKCSPHGIDSDKKAGVAEILNDEETEMKSKRSNKKLSAVSDNSRPKRGRPRVSLTSAKKADDASGERSSKSPATPDHSSAKQDENPLSDVEMKKDDQQSSDVQVGSAKQVGNEVDKVDTAPVKESQVRKGRPRKSVTSSEKPVAEKDAPSGAMLSPEAISRDGSDKDQDVSGEALAKKSRRKRDQSAKEVSNVWDQNVIGKKIEVWWPDDKKFYPGIIEDFDPSTGQHKVVYKDGDIENLILENERFNFKRPGKAGKSVNAETDETSPIPARKKVKIDSDSSKKANDDSRKRGSSAVKSGKRGGLLKSADDADVDANTPEAIIKHEKSGGSSVKQASGKKAKEKVSGSKSKASDSVEASSKKNRTPKSEMKDETISRTGRKLKDADLEDDTKGKDAASASNKSGKKIAAGKDSESAETGRKRKGATTPKSGGKSSLNGTSKKEKSAAKLQAAEESSPKVEEEAPRKRGRVTKS